MAGAVECDVLVVGAGPTGVTLGLLLARQGVRTWVIDKEAEIYPLPRAAHIDHETMRTFQSLGVADAIAATCRTSPRYDFLNGAGDVLMRFEGLDRIGPGGWPVGNMIHQPSVEAILRDSGQRQANLELRTSWRFVAYEEGEGGVTVKVETPAGELSLRARYLVGADGARSPVRQAAGIELHDLQFDEQWLVIDTIVQDYDRLPKVNLQICDPDRPTTCVLMGSGRHRWEFMLKPDESAEQMMDDGVISNLLRPWNVEGAVSLERKVVYRFNAKLAQVWRKGHVLLAGDAAHLTPPFAGQGLCAGVRDAANLAWKLEAVIQGGSSERLLDDYQSERAPHARALIELAMMMGRTVCIADPEAAKARDDQMLAARAAGAPSGDLPAPTIGDGSLHKGSTGVGTYFPQPSAGSSRLDDVLGPGAWLISRRGSSNQRGGGFGSWLMGRTRNAVAPECGLTERSLDDPQLSAFKQALDHWLSAHDAEGVLVLPDRYVFGTGDPGALREAWIRKLS